MKILNWNIRNPSLQRAQHQVEWILQTKADIIILTEAKDSKGCELIYNLLNIEGFKVLFPHYMNNDYCVIIAIKERFFVQEIRLNTIFLPHRIISAECEIYTEKIRIIGLYVPSRGPKECRNVNKKKFQEEFMTILASISSAESNIKTIIGGDLNVVERNHFPHYPLFREWEYQFYEAFLKHNFVDAYSLMQLNSKEHSWFGKKGSGYRFDHFFTSTTLSQQVLSCLYIHSPRNLGLSDHSGMTLTISPSPIAL